MHAGDICCAQGLNLVYQIAQKGMQMSSLHADAAIRLQALHSPVKANASARVDVQDDMSWGGAGLRHKVQVLSLHHGTAAAVQSAPCLLA